MRSFLLACGVVLSAAVATVGCGSSQSSATKTPTSATTPAAARTTTVLITSTVTAPTATTPTTTRRRQDFATFGDGTYTVRSTVKPGTYRAATPTSTCHWQRLGGGLDHILASDTTSEPTVVTILPTDARFKTSGCGTWTSDLSAITQSNTSFPAGTYIVNVDIVPGTYSAPGGGGCTWTRLSGFTGTLGDIISSGFSSGNVVVTIAPGDKGFRSSSCGTFTQTSPATAQPKPKSG
jgi:hypothetical protein